MTDDDTLYGLLPAIDRLKDAQRDYPLRTLLRAITAQADELAAAIEQQYDNWFIETCADDVIPYFAALVGVDLGAPLGVAAGPGVSTDMVTRRALVANAIAGATRKGSFSVLEQIAADATGWPARAVELAPQLMSTATVRFPGLAPRALLDIADGEELELLATPFATAPRLADVRRVSSHRRRSLANPSGVAIWLWRLVADFTARSPACCLEQEHHYAFDPLGRAVSLAVVPTPRQPAAAPPSDLDVATPITRLALARRLEDYYGPQRSLCIFRGSHPVPREEILVADLERWRHATPVGHVSIDPVLGRIAFPARHPPEEGVWVRYAQLSIGAIGGGHYARPTPTAAGKVYRVGVHAVGGLRSIRRALEAWAQDKAADPSLRSAVIEIVDDGLYDEPLDVTLAPGEELVICAASGCRPILWPAPEHSNQPDVLRVRGVKEAPGPAPGAPKRRGRGRRAPAGEAKQSAEAKLSAEAKPAAAGGAGALAAGGAAAGGTAAPALTLDGLCVAGHPLQLEGWLGQVTISNCTLLPARGLPFAGEPRNVTQPSLIVRALPCPVSVASSVLGRVLVDVDEVGIDPVRLTVRDSVIDAGDAHGEAIEAAQQRRAWVKLTLRRVTILGAAHVREVGVIEDCLLTAPLRCERRQVGEVQFSFVSPGSQTPRRTSCQPDGALAAVDAAIARGALTMAHGDRERRLAITRVTPRFDSVRAGEPAYARLAADTPPALSRGAHDEGELGAYHDLWQALRLAELRAQLQEFAPVGIDIDIRLAT